MGLKDYDTEPGVLVVRARHPESFEAREYGEPLGPGPAGLTEEDIEAMRSDGLFPLRPDPEHGAGLIGGELPDEIVETLTLVKGPRGPVLGSRRLTIRTAPGLTNAQIDTLCEKGKLEYVRRLGPRSTSFTVKIPMSADPLDFAHSVEATLGDAATRVMPEFLFRYVEAWSLDATLYPLYPKQWHWYEPPAQQQGTGAAAPQPINIEAAWDDSKGRNVRIAVIDKTFDVDHPDLTNAILDTSGYFPSAELADFQQGRAKVRTGVGTHGTICAAMAAAHPAEGRGILGAAPEANLVLLSVDAWTSLEILSRALLYVRGDTFERPLGCLGQILAWFVPVCTNVDFREAEVVCMSNKPFGDRDGYEDVLEALDELATTRDGAGLPLFAPAGNDQNEDVSNDPVLNHSQAIVVTQVSEDGEWVASSRGSCIDFAAPGYKVLTAYPQWCNYSDDVEYAVGTSFAAPCAGGVAALLLGVRPWLSTGTVRAIMKRTCDPLAGVASVSVGAGRINAGDAVKEALLET